MMKRRLFATLTLLGCSAPVSAAASDFVGTWVNSNTTTRGVTRINITGSGDKLSVRVFGRCTPADCDWGSAPVILFSPNVSSSDYGAATAIFNKGFSTTTLVITQQGQGNLGVQLFTQFTDSSGRQNYLSSENFVKY